MFNLSKKTSFRRRLDIIKQFIKVFIGSALLARDIFIVYISGLLVIMGALLMSRILQLNSWEQATLVLLIIGAVTAIWSVIYEVQLPNPKDVKTNLDRRKATAKRYAPQVLIFISWLSILVSTVALIWLIWISENSEPMIGG